MVNVPLVTQVTLLSSVNVLSVSHQTRIAKHFLVKFVQNAMQDIFTVRQKANAKD